MGFFPKLVLFLPASLGNRKSWFVFIYPVYNLLMKKIILWGLAGFFLSCHSSPQFEFESSMPVISMLRIDSSTYSTSQISEGRYTAIFYFRTDCPHCQMEMANILKSSNDLKTLNIIFLSIKPLKDLLPYAKYFKLANYPNILTACDNKYEFFSYYRPSNVPYMVVYGRSKKLYRIYDGAVSVDSLTALTKL